MFHRVVLVFVIAIFTSQLAQAETVSDKTNPSREPDVLTSIAELPFTAAETLLETFFEMGDSIVSGTRIFSPFEDFVAGSISSTTSITAEDIENSGARNIPEAIQYSEGVVLSDLVGNGEEPTLDFRNFTEGQDVALLIDGIRVNEAKSNNINYPLIPISMVKSIEISRGAESFLHGEGAVGGVVHVVTKMPEEGVRSEATARAGSFDEWGANVETSVKEGDWGLYLAGDYYETNGFRDNGSVEKAGFFSRVMKDITDQVRIEGSYLYADARLDRPGSIRESLISSRGRDATERDRNFADLNSHLGYLTLRSVFLDQLALSGNVYVSRTEEISVANFATFDTNDNELDLTRKSVGYTLQAHHSREFGNFVDGLVMGVDYQDNEVDEEDFNRSKLSLDRQGTSADLESSKETLGFFGKADISWKEKVGAYLGLRYDEVDFENTDKINTGNNVPKSVSKLSYSLGGAVRFWEKLNVSLSFASAFRTPNLSDLYANPGFGGNPNLDPEESSTYELGFKWDEKDTLVSSTLFANTLKNEIAFDPDLTDPNSPFGQNANFGKVRRYGIETVFDKQITPWLKVRAAHTNAEATFKTGTPTNPGRASKRVPMVPKNRYTANILVMPFEDFKISMDMVSVSKQVLVNDLTNEANGRRLPAYSVFNLKVMKQLQDWGLSFEVKNLFDEDYESGGSIGLTSVTDSRSDNFFVVGPERSYHVTATRKF